MIGYYACACGTSNTPCAEHHPGAPEMPDDWMETYVPRLSFDEDDDLEDDDDPVAGGPTDGFSAE